MPMVIVGGGVVSWLMALQWQLSSRLTREEHERICGKQYKVLVEKLDESKLRQEQELKETREYRDHMSNSLHSLQLKMGVLEALDNRRQVEHERQQRS